MRILLPVLGAALLAGSVWAQARVPVDLPDLQMVETRHGVLSVDPKPAGQARGFLLDGQPIEGPLALGAHVQVVLPQPQGGPEDWVLVSLSDGSKDCPLLFAFVVLSEAGATATDPFGTCVEVIVDLRETEGTKVAFDMIGFTDGRPSVHIYRFDGVTVEETVNPLR